MTKLEPRKFYGDTIAALLELAEKAPKPPRKAKAFRRWGPHLIDYTTGQTYPTLKAMAEAFGTVVPRLKRRLYWGTIAGHVIGWSDRPKPEPKLETWRRPVRCVETGQTWPSLADASRSIGVRPTALHNALKRHRRTAGLRFEYAEGRAA